MASGPLVVIAGQTASGKTALAIRLAQSFNGEIVCADSRTVYRYMDIGTAKPSKSEQEQISHHLLDIVDPDEKFNAVEMKKIADKAIEDINSRGKTAFLVGGTGLFISAVIYNFRFGPKDDSLRSRLDNLSLSELQEEARKIGISDNDISFDNKRHLARAVERGGMVKDEKRLRDNCLFIGINQETEELKKRMKSRLENMLESGLENEVRRLAEKYGWSAPGMNAICYKEWEGYFAGEQSLEKTKQKLYKDTWHYAKRQKTWFKRDKNIHWVTSGDEAVRLVQQFLIQ
ncbi:MAG TPA: tRNA (adenosine(37)-N6)-dimethylallyltransferase MiaA [Candidatus Saccharimonadales bacterium]|nr:tRNA (adenosine(37)-N6)-dimethylallyltransferase MiaA [Candidatus Saccharimonadales bacterium]